MESQVDKRGVNNGFKALVVMGMYVNSNSFERSLKNTDHFDIGSESQTHHKVFDAARNWIAEG